MHYYILTRNITHYYALLRIIFNFEFFSAKPPPLQVVTPAPRHSLDPKESDVEYYNDLPGKTPPEFSPVQKSSRPISGLGSGSNLIDFHSDLKNNQDRPEYVNDDVHANPPPRKQKDIFDMSPFATNAPGGGFPDMNAMKLQLLKEEWFHGPISRVDAENLLQNVRTLQVFRSHCHLTNFSLALFAIFF